MLPTVTIVGNPYKLAYLAVL